MNDRPLVRGAVGLGGAQVGQVLPGGGQDVGQVVRGVAGVSQLGARGGDDPAWVGTGVGPDTADVVFRAQPPIELVQQLRERLTSSSIPR